MKKNFVSGLTLILTFILIFGFIGYWKMRRWALLCFLDFNYIISDVKYLFSIPTFVKIIGVDVDVDRIISTIAPIDGDKSKVKKFMILAGYNRSIFEHLDLEIPLNTPAISAVKAIQIASDQGIPMHKIDATNINIILPKLKVSQEVITNIRNAVNAGKEVTVPEREIIYNGWKGTGYIITDPATGEGAYLISGGKDGAAALVSEGVAAKHLEEYTENSALIIEGDPTRIMYNGYHAMLAVGATFQLGYSPIWMKHPTAAEFLGLETVEIVEIEGRRQFRRKEIYKTGEIHKDGYKILYFAGHASPFHLSLGPTKGLEYDAFVNTKSGSPYFPPEGSNIRIISLEDALKDRTIPFKFVFLSGCHTGEETSWDPKYPKTLAGVREKLNVS